MANVEDAASVLEHFINDVANLPNEIAHIYEEIQAKDKQCVEIQKAIAQRDRAIQQFIKQHGSHVVNPKEETYTNYIRKAYTQLQLLQDEKIVFAQKAADLMDRHIRRLDSKIKDLQTENMFPNEPIPLPTHPLIDSSGIPSRNYTHQPSHSRNASRRVSPASHIRTSSLSGDKTAASSPTGSITLNNGVPSGPTTPGGGPDNKRRRIVGPNGMVMSVTAAGPTSMNAGNTPSEPQPPRKRRGGTHKPRRNMTEEEDDDDDEHDDDDDDDDDNGDDKRLYCYCQQVSWGNMVACDDSDCRFEWFHWGCVNLTKEPPGKWYCDTCKRRREQKRSD